MSIMPMHGAKLELTETALKLSKVIERESKRHSALHNSNMARVQANMPSPRRTSGGRTASTARSMRSVRSMRHSSVTVAPTPDAGPRPPNDRSGAAESAPALERQESRRKSDFVSQSEATNEGEEPAGLRQAAWRLLDDPNSSPAAYYVSVFVFSIIVLSTVTFIAATEPSLSALEVEIGYIETLCAIIFTLELGLRVLFCPDKPAFFRTLSNWIDIASILPFYLDTILDIKNASSLAAVRIVRLTRVARVLRMSRYSSAIQVFMRAISTSAKPLSMLIFLMSIAIIIFSSAVFFAELTPDGCRSGGWVGDCSGLFDKRSGAVVGGRIASTPAEAAAIAASSLPETCLCVDPNPYRSITASFWWSMVTMSTVGYGDMTPVTVLGKMVGCATVLTGMIVLALPITVIGTNFQKVMKSVMHETMKTNVDYLKGKRMLCRDEIQAILERFHAVTENIHLDIDDVINVYDTDNSGMLEDEELARFRHDLEVLQNRAMMSQIGVSDVGLPQRTAASVVASTTSQSAASGLASPGPSRASFANIKQVATMKSIVRRMTSSSQAGPMAQPPMAVLPTLEAHADSDAESDDVVDSFPIQSRVSSKHKSEGDQSTLSRSSTSLMIDEEQLLLRLLDMQHSIEDRVLETEQRLETKINNLTKILMRLERMMELDD